MTLNDDQKQAILWWISWNEEAALGMVLFSKEKERIGAYAPGTYERDRKCYETGMELKKILTEEKKKVIL
jgi:hypothetical protein